MRRLLLGCVLATVTVAACPSAQAAPVGPAAAEPSFGPLTAPIRPGIDLDTGGGRCTANFVFRDDAGRIYLGQAAHCAQDAADDSAPNPETCSYGRQLPLGTPVRLGKSDVTGTLAYSSWTTMQTRAEKQADVCRFNDFSLVEIPAAAAGQVNPSVPMFGGPTGLNTDGVQQGDLLTGWGNSPLRQGIDALAPKHSVAVRTDPSGRAHLMYSITPGVPGDSGGPCLDAEGRALGSLSEIALDPPGANITTDIARALAYAETYAGFDGLRLVPGTAPFAGPLLVGP